MATLHYYVRSATIADSSYIVNLSARVQDALIASGSLQQLGPIPDERVAALVAGSYAHILIDSRRPIGSVFVAPASEEIIARFGPQPFAEGKPVWFLSKLMIEPQQQGKGLGNLLLDAAKDIVTRIGGVLALDCWAGNDKLRMFYTRAGFRLHGIFPDNQFEVAVFIWDCEPSAVGVESLPQSILRR